MFRPFLGLDMSVIYVERYTVGNIHYSTFTNVSIYVPFFSVSNQNQIYL